MKIVKKGENSVANGASMGANALSDEDLEGVGGGYTRKKTKYGDLYYFNEKEARILENCYGRHVIPGKGYDYDKKFLSRLGFREE